MSRCSVQWPPRGGYCNVQRRSIDGVGGPTNRFGATNPSKDPYPRAWRRTRRARRPRHTRDAATRSGSGGVATGDGWPLQRALQRGGEPS